MARDRASGVPAAPSPHFRRLAEFWRAKVWELRYSIQRAFGLECEWVLVPDGVPPKGFYRARCRWCGLYMRRETPS